MAQSRSPLVSSDELPAPDVSHLVTEDDAPVDSLFSEKQMRLLTEPLYATWQSPQGRPFVVAANVGVFAAARNPALVPDVFLSMDVSMPAITGPDRVRSYFVWEFGKPPDVVIEIVSDTQGGELSDKLRSYERMRVAHYVVFDPLRVLRSAELSVFSLEGMSYVQRDGSFFERIGLGVTPWEGMFEGVQERWLRWCDAAGDPIPTGAEHAEHERQRAEHERQRAEHERQRAEHERQRAERLAERLKAAGISSDEDE